MRLPSSCLPSAVRALRGGHWRHHCVTLTSCQVDHTDQQSQDYHNEPRLGAVSTAAGLLFAPARQSTMGLPRTATVLMTLAAVAVAVKAVRTPEGEVTIDDLLRQTEQHGINFNSLLDEIIVSARKALIVAKEDSLSLPDFTEDFYHKIWPFVVHGHLHCTKGSLRSLSSVRRTGDAKLAYEKKKLLVITPLGLDELVVNYDYDGSILHMGTTGNLTANVTSNSVTLAVEISMSMAGCKLKMDEAKITNFGPIAVTLTGLYPFDGLSSIIAEKAADSLHDTIRQTAEQILQKRLQKVIDKIPCHLPGGRV